MNDTVTFSPAWKWGTAEGSREFDRIVDRSLSFRENVRWLEETESLTLAMRSGQAGPSVHAAESSSRTMKLKTDGRG